MPWIDMTTDRGRHVQQRLERDIIAWLTTVRPNGQPDTVPVWFLWEDETVLIYSRPDKMKLHNIQQNPRVSLVLDNTHGGGDVIRVEGVAALLAEHPPLHEHPTYLAKYARNIEYIGYDAEGFARAYNVALCVTPTRVRY